MRREMEFDRALWKGFCDTDDEIQAAMARVETWRKAQQTGKSCAACGSAIPKTDLVYHTSPEIGTDIGDAVFYQWGIRTNGFAFPVCASCLGLTYLPWHLEEIRAIPTFYSCSGCARSIWLDPSFWFKGGRLLRNFACSDRCAHESPDRNRCRTEWMDNNRRLSK